jgi:hypothetical protein
MPANTIMERRDRFARRFPWLPAACGVCAILDADTVLLRIAVAYHDATIAAGRLRDWAQYALISRGRGSRRAFERHRLRFMRGLQRCRLDQYEPPEHRRRRLVEVRQPAHRWRDQRLLGAARPATLAVRRQRQIPERITRLKARNDQQVHQQRAYQRPRHEPAVP